MVLYLHVINTLSLSLSLSLLLSHSRTHTPLTAIPYTIHVVAGAPPAVKPTPCLVVTLLGTRGHTHPIKLEPVDGGYITGSNVGTETFSVEGADVGSITAIKVCNLPPLVLKIRWLCLLHDKIGLGVHEQALGWVPLLGIAYGRGIF